MEPRVVQADNAGLFTLSGTRTHLVGSVRVAVVDPGPADPMHLGRLVEELRGAEEATLLVTHAHADHSAGAHPLRRALESEGVGRARVLGPAPGADRDLAHGERVETDAGTLRAVSTPGHARPHFSFLWEETRVLLAGDLFLGVGNTAWVGSYPGCVGEYLASLDRVEALSPSRILPAHGPPLEEPGEAVARFREHRLRRVQQVAGVLAEEPDADEERIVERVYGPALPPELREAARWSVRALLDHLAVRPFPEGAPAEEG